MQTNETPIDLPALEARTGESVRIDTPDESGTTLGLEQVVQEWNVSLSTLRRRLNDGGIPGAHKKPSKKGEKWAIPVAALEAAGYRRRSDVVTTREERRNQALLNDQQSELMTALLDQLNRQQAALEAATDRGRQDQEALQRTMAAEAYARGRLEVLEQQVAALQGELEAIRTQAPSVVQPPRRRGLFRKGG